MYRNVHISFKYDTYLLNLSYNGPRSAAK
jgi:hypothetical protein